MYLGKSIIFWSYVGGSTIPAIYLNLVKTALLWSILVSELFLVRRIKVESNGIFLSVLFE